MGIVARQGMYNSIASYLGVILGGINTLVLFPNIFSADEFGLTRVIGAASVLASTLFSLGFPNVLLKFFPHFRDKDKKHNGVLFFMLLIPTFGYFLFLLLSYFFKENIIGYYSSGSTLFGDYYSYILILTAYLVYFNLFDAYLRSLYKSVLYTFLQNVVLRFLWMSLILLYHFKYINFDEFIFWYVNVHAILVIVEVVYIIYLKEFYILPNFKKFDKKIIREIGIFSSFIILGASSGLISGAIDSLMVGALMEDGLDNVAFYSVALYIGVIVVIPYNGIVRIINSIIAESWKNNDVKKIDTIYKQTSNNLMLIGTLLFLGIWLNVDNIFEILPAEYSGGKYVLLFILFAKLFEVSTGVNASIIQFSPFFKVMLYFNGLLITLLVISNFIFIPIYGIVGAAIATFISIFIVNTIRLIVLKVKMGILPFTKKSILTPIFGLITYAIVYFIPPITPFYIDIIVRSIIIIILFIPPVYFLNVSEEFNALVNKSLKIIKLKK